MNDFPPYLKDLNPQQRDAAITSDGPLLVLAGAGSGKTSMLTRRIAHLVLGRRVSPDQILAVTFTNKAAQEMKHRVSSLLQHSSAAILKFPEIGTFHGICLKILRQQQIATPFKNTFVILDDADQLTLVKDVLNQLKIDTKAINPKWIQQFINRAKCDALEPHEVDPSRYGRLGAQGREIYTRYQTQLFANDALDFGEIICMAYRILRDHEPIRKLYQKRFQYIHVDEYQDTNRSQYLFLSYLSKASLGGSGNLCVVGDEDQSIYRWRGADIHNILDFEEDYPNAKTVKLEQNYRSTQTIVEAASALISHNQQRKDKKLWAQAEVGSPIVRWKFQTERAEAEGVVREIQKWASLGDYFLKEIAIFYRTHAQSRQFEDFFRKLNIPYQIIGGLRFFERKEIKDVLAYFRAALNRRDSLSLRRIINVPGRGIGKTTLTRLEEQLFEDKAADYWTLLQNVTKGQAKLTPRAVKSITSFVNTLDRITGYLEKSKLVEFYHRVLDETGYVQDLKSEGTLESEARIENLKEFENLLSEIEEEFLREGIQDRWLERFLERTSLESSQEMANANTDAVQMMTLHSAKGLEFPIVFLVGMEEGLFPSTRAWEETDPEELEEERRLCYVGMTRAKRHLYLCHADQRRIQGEFHFQEPARFFEEIPQKYINFKFENSTSEAGSRFVDDTNRPDWKGFPVNHPTFGMGTIVETEGIGENSKVLVEFGGHVRKKFLLRYLLNGNKNS